MYRQGDVLLIPREIPENAKLLKSGSRVILAEGEATGHTHSMLGALAVLLATDNARFLRVQEDVPLEHQEHAPITVPAGDYQIVIQREYTPEEIRNVKD